MVVGDKKYPQSHYICHFVVKISRTLVEQVNKDEIVFFRKFVFSVSVRQQLSNRS